MLSFKWRKGWREKREKERQKKKNKDIHDLFLPLYFITVFSVSDFITSLSPHNWHCRTTCIFNLFFPHLLCISSFRFLSPFSLSLSLLFTGLRIGPNGHDLQGTGCRREGMIEGRKEARKETRKDRNIENSNETGLRERKKKERESRLL